MTSDLAQISSPCSLKLIVSPDNLDEILFICTPFANGTAPSNAKSLLSSSSGFKPFAGSVLGTGSSLAPDVELSLPFSLKRKKMREFNENLSQKNQII